MFPPENVKPHELFLKLQERPAPSVVIDFPAKLPGGTEVPRVRVQVLPMQKHDDAQFSARDYLRSRRKMSDADLATPFGISLLGDATAREIVALSTVSENVIGEDKNGSPIYARVFRGAEDVNKLTADEVTVLFSAYCLAQRQFGPFEREMSDAEVNAWVLKLQEGGQLVPLAQLESHQREELLLSLVARASCLSKLLESQRQNLPINWESIPTSWVIGTTYSTEPAAESAPSQTDNEEGFTMEQATDIARSLFKREPKKD